MRGKSSCGPQRTRNWKYIQNFLNRFVYIYDADSYLCVMDRKTVNAMQVRHGLSRIVWNILDSRFKKGFEIREAYEQMAHDIRVRSGIWRSARNMLVDLSWELFLNSRCETQMSCVRQPWNPIGLILDSRYENRLAGDQADKSRFREEPGINRITIS